MGHPVLYVSCLISSSRYLLYHPSGFLQRLNLGPKLFENEKQHAEIVIYAKERASYFFGVKLLSSK